VAKQIITRITDDLDGGEADETVHFSLDGNGFAIDLSSRNANELRVFLEKYMEAGTRTGRVAAGQHAQVSRYHVNKQQTGLNREQNQKIRAWAAQNGWELADRGRIPQMIVDAFESKTPNPQWLAEKEAADKVAAEVKTPRARKATKAAAGKPAFTS
jgi:hypothetical protein